MPIKEGVGANNGYKQQVGNNSASTSNPSAAMNHLLLGKKPLVNSKPRRGPHPGAIPPEVRKSSNTSEGRSFMVKKSFETSMVPKELNKISSTKNTTSQKLKNGDSGQNPVVAESESSIQDTPKARSMSVTHVACPQVNNQISYIRYIRKICVTKVVLWLIFMICDFITANCG